MNDSADNANGANPDVENVEKCPLCGCLESTFLFWNYDRLYRLPGEFGTVVCDECSLIRLSPRPTRSSIGLYYPDDYGAYLSPGSADTADGGLMQRVKIGVRNSVLSSLGYDVGRLASWQRLLRPLFLRLFYAESTYSYGNRFPRFVPDGRALEVGCGNCVYLSYLKRHGWAVTGVDLSAQAARTAKEAYGIDVIIGEIEESGLKGEQFDYIHLSHVVEHFFDPLSSMRFIVGLLKPNGLLYMEVPNGKGIGAEMSGKYWYGWDAPRHLFTFAPDTSRRLLENSGLTIVEMTTGLTDTFAWETAYRREEVGGHVPTDRLQLSTGERSQVKSQDREAKRRFANRPFGGDYVSCWARKPI